MRKFLTIVTLVFSLFLFSNVHAVTFETITLTDDTTLTGGAWKTNNAGYYFNSNGFRTLEIATSNVGDLLASADYQYGFVSYCSYDNIYETYRQNTLKTVDMLMFNTYVKSAIYGSSIPCTVKYITWKFIYDCGADGRSCLGTGRFKFYGDISDYSLRSYGFTKEPLQIDTTTGQILNQNATIIDQNNTIINNQEDIKNNTEDIKNTLNDDSIDTDQSNSFFDNFDESSDHLLTSVVLFPIKILDNLDSECRELNFPFSSDKLKINDVSLPCGNTLFWDKPKVAEFKKFWNFIVGAPIIYGCLLWTFKTIQKLKNPFDNEVEMIELW